MMRSSRVYRRYGRRTGQRRGSMRIGAVILSVFILLALLATYAQKKVFPYILEVSEMKTRSLITEMVESVINDEFGRSPSYDDIAFVGKDSLNRVTSIQINANRLTMLSTKIAGQIQEKLFTEGKKEIGVPLGTLLGSAVFSAEGPDIYVKFIPVGQVEASYKSEFSNAGSNQTRHWVSLEVKATIGVAVPLVENRREITVEVPLAETVVIGNVPDTVDNNVHKTNKTIY